MLLTIALLDKWNRTKHSRTSCDTDQVLTRRILESLPESTGFTEICQARHEAWCQRIPKNILHEDIEIFSDRDMAIDWLVANNSQLNGDISADIYRSPKGKEKVLMELHQIKWNVYLGQNTL